MSKKILIMGATGRVGAELVRLLTEKGEALRAATRSPSTASARLPRFAEAVEFDFDRPETFAPALKGVAKVFLIARPGDNHADKVAMPFIDMAKKEGVPISQLVAFLLYEPIFQLEKRTISLWGYKTASGCPKFECNLDLKRRAEEVSRKS